MAYKYKSLYATVVLTIQNVYSIFTQAETKKKDKSTRSMQVK